MKSWKYKIQIFFLLMVFIIPAFSRKVGDGRQVLAFQNFVISGFYSSVLNITLNVWTHAVILTLLLLNMICPVLANSVDLDLYCLSLNM